MKKIIALLLVSILVFGVAGCSCKHEFAEATCTAPKTCKHCGTTEGAALGHKWQEATLAAPKTCEVCEATEGTSLFYQCNSWNEVFQLAFNDEFDFPVSEGDHYQLNFLEVKNLNDFMVDAMVSCMTIGVHCDMCKASTVTLTLENECMILCFVPESASIPHTMLIVMDNATKGDEIQSLYNKYFVTMGMDLDTIIDRRIGKDSLK